MLSELNFIHDEFQFLRICCCSITRLFNHREAFSKQSSSMEGSGPFSAQVVHYLNSTMEPPPTTITKTDTTTEEVDNPDNDSCIVKDQQILNYLLSSPFRDILAQVATLFWLLLLFWMNRYLRLIHRFYPPQKYWYEAYVLVHLHTGTFGVEFWRVF